MNRRAREVLGLAEGVEVVGRRCHEIVGAMRENEGRAAYDGCGTLVPFCSARCPIFDRVEKGEELEPVELCVISREAGEHWIQLLPILVRAGDEQLLVHCALPADREHRMEHYLAQVAGRSPHRLFSTAMQSLSPRELETLDLLAQDLTPADIADRLHVSYVTVRNHVQHVLAKLEVHSTMEAVALYLLEGEAGGRWDPTA